MTFKKPEMEKTLRNGLIMSEMDPLNHIQLDFAIQSGLPLRQFQRKLLLKDKTPGDMYGLTPLHFAAMRGQLEMCKLILEMVDNKNPRTPHAIYGKWTPLDWAEESGHFEVCRLITSAIGKYFLRPKRLKIYK